MLERLGLGSEAQRARRNGIGGSDANIILSGDAGRIHRLWTEKRGEAEPEDLSALLPAMLGCWTEAFNRQWYERETGNLVADAGKIAVSDAHPWRRCTIDGFVPSLGAVWEAKHTSAFSKSDEVVARYMPQLQHNMAVLECGRSVLSVIFGNSKWEIFEIASDWLYQEELLIAEVRFWNCVRTGESPVPAPVPPPPKPVGVREICLEGNNAWAAAAADWLAYREAARLHGVATAAIKELVEPDVKRAHGHGIEARRSKSGALSIRELVQ
ncbi:MAG: YqaJ viral recombinase family protein [Sphingosinicella sp.]|uniref:YqaJ viral recombinase family protein n=1 Tax=Sphingosinicella sp. TaxID=1917971 RepID=UPI004037CCDE